MSSNAATLSPNSGGLMVRLSKAAILAGLFIAAPLAAQEYAAPLAAQDDESATDASESATAAASEAEAAPEPAPPPRRRQFDRINLTVTVPKDESDEFLAEDCEEEADAMRIAGEIVVCRQLGEASDGSWNKEDFERRYAERTQGEQPVDVAGGGIFSGPATFGSLCIIPPCPPEAALMIDVEALPEAPEGSDADRIARGLPPLGQDPEPTPEEIAERRRALGLDAPPIPDTP